LCARAGGARAVAAPDLGQVPVLHQRVGQEPRRGDRAGTLSTVRVRARRRPGRGGGAGRAFQRGGCGLPRSALICYGPAHHLREESMKTMLSKLFVAGVFSTVLAANLGLTPVALASTGPVRASAGTSGAAARVYAEDDKKK